MELLQTEKVVATGWFLYLEPLQQKLVKHALELYRRELTLDSNLPDYSFLVFTLSKAYEGFLKKYLRDLELISVKVYEGRKFRIGRALNPDVHTNHRDQYWLYDDLAQVCGPELARQLWETWLQCRNRVFHYFPNDPNIIDLETAEKFLLMLISAMEKAVACKISLKK